MEFLSQFHYTIVYLPGPDNVVADALSRRPDYEDTTVAVKMLDISVPTPFLDEVRTSYKHDSLFGTLYQFLKDPSYEVSARIRHIASIYLLDGDLLYYSPPDCSPRLCIPSENNKLRLQLLQEHHDTPVGAHQGSRKLYDALARSFYWPRMVQHCRRHVSSCEKCQRGKSRNSNSRGLMLAHRIPDDRWKVICLDIAYFPKSTLGSSMVLVVVDRLSKRVRYIALSDGSTTCEIAAVLFDRIIAQHGLPDEIISDLGPQFESSLWRELWSFFGTTLQLATANHHQTAGQAERAIRTLNDALRIFVDHQGTNWDTQLSVLEFAHNNSIHASTGFSPFYLDTGRHPKTPLSMLIPKPARKFPMPLLSILDDQHLALQQAREALIRASVQQKRYADKGSHAITFQVGDQVLVATSAMNTRSLGRSSSRKLSQKFIGPFTIYAVKQPGRSYHLRLPPSFRFKSDAFHVEYLKAYCPTPAEDIPHRSNAAPTVQMGNHEAHQVERILATRKRGNANHYQVRWLGHNQDQDSWVSEHELQINCSGLLDEFNNRQVTAPRIARTTRSKPNASRTYRRKHH
jgi:hypothetical protein